MLTKAIVTLIAGIVIILLGLREQFWKKNADVAGADYVFGSFAIAISIILTNE